VLDYFNWGGGQAGAKRGGSELSLEEILMLYSQPINEEQAWAVCYQCCINLGPQDVRIQKDGAVKLQYEGCDGRRPERRMNKERDRLRPKS
uniref:KIND domain-containing protein n=1 Tax=Hucho hucho TaxID=62062 RepID=A0A4W5QNI6_9TELE